MPGYMAFDETTGTLVSKKFTQAINVTWRFAKAGIEFTADGIIYIAEKDGATIAFTKDGVRMNGISKRQVSGEATKTDTTKTPFDQSPRMPEAVLGKWIALDNKDHYVIVSADGIQWERGDPEGPVVVSVSKCKVFTDKHSVSFPVSSSLGALTGGKIVRGTVIATMTATKDSLTISEGTSDTIIKDDRSGFAFELTGAEHVFRKAQDK